MRQVAPRRATPRALTPSWPRPAPADAPCCAMAQSVCRHASRPNNSPAGNDWPDLLHRRQESPAKMPDAPAPVQVARSRQKERSSWSERSKSASGCSFSRSCQPLRPAPETDPGWRRSTSSCRVAVFCCCTRPVSCRAQVFEFISLIWVELRDSNPGPLACHSWRNRLETSK
jgi:hypothetical protein